MRIKKLTFKNKSYTDKVLIDDILLKNGLSWVNKAEIENAVIEIKDGKLYWYGGIWYFGDWDYGLWLDGEFRYGNWYNGVFYNGNFKNGTWHNGVFMNGTFTGEFIKGDFRNTDIVKFSDYKK